MRDKSGIIDMKKIGKRIQDQRKLCGLSQEKLAEQISRSSHYISDIECGRKHPSEDTMAKIAGALQISLDYIYWGTQKDNSKAASVLHLIEQCTPEDLDLLEIYLRSLLEYHHRNNHS